MERITTLLEKIKELNDIPNPSLIEVDLMMDYSRVLYADLFEWRKKLAFNDAVTTKPAPVPVSAPTVTENPAESYKNYQTAMDSAPPTAPAKAVNLTEINYPSKPVTTEYPQPRYSNADIRQNVGINDKYLFISELFGNNTDAYEEVVNELNTFDTEEEAIVWLNNSVSNQFDWKEDSDTVQAFYKTLADFFAGR